MSAVVPFQIGGDTDPDAVAEGRAIFHRYQSEVSVLALSADFLVIEKSRRIGISWCLAGVSVLIASPAEGAMNVFYSSYSFEMTRTFIDDCASFLKAFSGVSVQPDEFLWDDGDGREIKSFRIDLPSGKSIIALSSHPRSIRSKQGVVILDEAALHDDLDEVITASLPLIMLGGRVIVLSTHKGAENPFNTLVNDIRSGKREGVVHRVTLADALADGFYKRICRDTGQVWSVEGEEKWEAALRKRQGDSAAEEFDCIAAQGSGVYMPRATIEAACSKDNPVVRLKCPEGFEREDLEWRRAYIDEWLEKELAPLLRKLDPTRHCYFGMDYGRVNDLSVFAPGQFDEDVTLNVPFILEMRNVPSREQWQILHFIISFMILFAAGKVDGRGNGQDTAAELQDHYGYDRIEAIMATTKTYLTLMPRLKARIEDRTIRVPWDEGIIDDLRLIALVNGVPMVVEHSTDKKDDGKRHGDGAVALMNLVAAADEGFSPFDFHTTGGRSSAAYAGTVTASASGSSTGARTFDDDYSL